MKVADVMRKGVVTVSPDATLRSACRIIFSGQIGGLPVVDKNGKLVGIVVEKDILSLFFPSMKEYTEDFTHARDFELMEDHIAENLNLPVKKFMSKNPLVISPQAPLLRAASTMIAKRVGKLPVVNSKKRLVGIISRGDIFRTIVRKRIPSLKGRVKRGADFFTRFAHHYDISFSWDQRLGEEIPFVVNYLKKYKAKAVLDLGCGTGEHTLALAKRGFKVTGVDQNEEMLASAWEKWEKQEEKIKKNVKFLQMTIGETSSLKDRQFDATICLGNMLPNVLDYDKEFLSLKKVLGKKAVFIIQIKNFDQVLAEEEKFISLDFSYGESPEQWEKEYAFLRFYDFRPDGLLNFNVETLASDGRFWHSYGVETNLQRPILKKDLSRVLTKLGFSKIRLFGSFKGERYNKETSPLLIAVATR